MDNIYFQDNSDIENKKFEIAKSLYLDGDYSKALKLYLDMVNTHYSWNLCNEIGLCYYKLEDNENAEKYFKESIRLEPRKNPSYTTLGNMYSKINKNAEAIEYWSFAHLYKPDDENVCLNLATTYFLNDMKFQAYFYYKKFLKYAKDKNTPLYTDISTGVSRLSQIGDDFYKKAKQAKSFNDYETAQQALEYAVTNAPYNFDINYSLADIYFQQKKYHDASIYFKQAYMLDTKSLDTVQKMFVAYLEQQDIYNAYCSLQRTLPLVMGNQQKYLETVKTLRELKSHITTGDKELHLKMADNYYKENNYHNALYEYQNSLLLSDTAENNALMKMVDRLNGFINPEKSIIRDCIEQGGVFYTNGDYARSDKFYKRVMVLAPVDSAEYKMAKARVKNV